jgi:hypothetical protein
MTDDLAPFFENRETRIGRLPEEARVRFELADKQAVHGGQTDFADRQFVSLWLSRRTGMPRKDVVANFDNITKRYFGEGATASSAWDSIATSYAPAEKAEKPEGLEATDEEYANTQGLPRVGMDAFLHESGQSGRSMGAGFEGFAQKIPAGMYSQLAGVTGAPQLPNLMANDEYKALKLENDRLENVYQFTAVFDEPGSYFGPQNELQIEKNLKRMSEIVQASDAAHREEVKKWADSSTAAVSKEYRELAGFWYQLSEGAADRWGVTPEFQATTLGQFMQSAGSVPATAALAVMGPGGWAGMESAFFADVESERAQAEGENYDPDKALPANLASAIPQMALEKAFGVERMLNNLVGEMPKIAGKLRFGDFAKQFVKQGLVAGVEEGLTEPSQGFWNDYVASISYDEQRELLTGDGAKRRLIESVSGFALGMVFGGGMSTVAGIDTNRAVAKGKEYLTTKDGQVMQPGDFRVLRQVKRDEEIAETAPDEEAGRLLIAAANGDTEAQNEYNNRVRTKLFVATDGVEVGGLTLGKINDVPVFRDADGMIVELDMTDPEARSFLENFKREAVNKVALEETAEFLTKGLEAGRELKISEDEKVLKDFVDEAKIDVEEAAKRIGVAQDVNAAEIPEGTAAEDIRVLGANVADYQAGVYKDVSTVFNGANPMTAVEEVAEGYMKKRLAVGDLLEADLTQWRESYEKETGEKTKTSGTVSNIEWFSKRVIDYAVANRKMPGMPKSWAAWFRTLGEHLKTIFRLSEKLKKLKRDGKLGAEFEDALKGALGLMPAEDSTAKIRQRGQEGAARANIEAAPTVSDIEADAMAEATATEGFPKITGNEGDGFVVTDPAGEEIGRAQELEAAQNIALKWYDKTARDEEKASARAEVGMSDASNELQNVIISKGGLLAASQENVFSGELKSMAENLTTGQRLRLFRKKGMPLDQLREALVAEGFEFETVGDLLDAIERSTRGASVFPSGGGNQQITFSLAPVGGQLLVVHNTTASTIRKVNELGGFAVPSVAVIKPATSKFTNFGEITLIAPPSMIDPKADDTSKAFNADIYSPRFPRVQNKVKEKALNAAWKKMGPQSKALGNLISSELDSGEIEREGLTAFKDSTVAMMAFLDAKGLNPQVVMLASDVSDSLKKFKGSRWELEDSPEFKKAVADDLRERLSDYPDVLADNIDEEGNALQAPVSRAARAVALHNKPEVDRHGSRDAFRKQIEEAGLQDEFAVWIRENFGDVIAGRKVSAGGNRWVPYDLESVVKVMKRELRDGEGFNYGVGNIRANVAIQFKSLEAMKKKASNIIPREQMEKLKEEVNGEFMTLASELAPFYRFEANRFGYLDEVSQAMTELATRGFSKWSENFKDVPPDLMKKVGEFLVKLKNMPTEYFEGKLQRGVKISEFVGAVVPDNTPADVLSILAESGVQTVEYPSGNDEARAAAVATFADATGVMDPTFALTGIPQNSTQALQAQALRLRAKKLAASGTLQARIAAGIPLPQRAKLVRRSTQASLLAKVAMPITARLWRIYPPLTQRLRRFEYDLGQAISRDFQSIQPFMTAFEKMKDTDARVLDLALKNGDTQTRDAVLAQYGMQAAFQRVEQVLAAGRARGIAAGYDIGIIEDYFPRKVNDLDGLMLHYYGKPQAGAIETALREAMGKAAANGQTLSIEERIQIVNSALQGYGPKSSKPSNFKGRKTDVVDVDADAFYADSVQALVRYIESVNQAVEKRRFFGKFVVNVAGTTSNKLALDASIGALVEDMIATDKLPRAKAAEVTAILEGRFNQGPGSQFVKNLKALSYLGTMGQVTSAITQITDLAFSMYENGVYETMVAAGKAVTRKSTITRKSLGLDGIAEEFRDMGKLQKILDGVFKAVGIHYLDLVGKETLVNAKFAKMQKEAAAGKLSTRSQQIINTSFGSAGTAVIADLAVGKKTEDTLFAVYTVLADYQPISMSEYPEAYLRHPNGRIFYMLKSFTLKQLEAFRREAFSLIVHGDAKQKAKGFKNLIHLAGLLWLAGVPLDWLKDMIMGRDPQLTDLMVDNVFKLTGVNRWNLWQFRERKNPLEAAMMLVVPPAPFFQYPLMDVEKSAKKIEQGEEIVPGDFESWRMLPLVGAPIYWWFGGGKEKTEKRARQREKEGR